MNLRDLSGYVGTDFWKTVRICLVEFQKMYGYTWLGFTKKVWIHMVGF